MQQKNDYWPLSRFKTPLDPITELKKIHNSGAYFLLNMVYEYKKVSDLKNWSTIKSSALDCPS